MDRGRTMNEYLHIRSKTPRVVGPFGSKPVISFNGIYNSLAGSGLQDS